MSFGDALLEVGIQLGHAIDPVVVHGLCDDRRREKSGRFEQFEPDALAAITQLHELGVKLAVVSNCFAEDVQAWPRCAAARWFDASVFSFDVGAAKPEAAIYLEATRRLDVEPREAVFVGDGGDDELLGAERVGLRSAQATWFRRDLADLPSQTPRLVSWQAVVELAAAG